MTKQKFVVMLSCHFILSLPFHTKHFKVKNIFKKIKIPNLYRKVRYDGSEETQGKKMPPHTFNKIYIAITTTRYGSWESLQRRAQLSNYSYLRCWVTACDWDICFWWWWQISRTTLFVFFICLPKGVAFGKTIKI